MSVQPPGASASRSPEPMRADVHKIAAEFREAITHFSEKIRNLSSEPHLADSPTALNDIAKAIQELDQHSKKALGG